MPDRSLVTAAVVVWSVAIFVAVFLGLPMLLTVEGIDIDAGLVVNAFAAFAGGATVRSGRLLAVAGRLPGGGVVVRGPAVSWEQCERGRFAGSAWYGAFEGAGFESCLHGAAQCRQL